MVSRVIPVEPFDLVIFGGTGDLARRKILPGLYRRFLAGQMPPEARVIGAARRETDAEGYRELAREAIREFVSEKHCQPDQIEPFLAMLDYISIDATGEGGWKELAGMMRSDAVQAFYFSVGPSLFGAIAERLNNFNVARQDARIVVEKPFGRDLSSAQDLNATLAKHFDEAQIYRIDHYLGKETVQNLMAIRFGNVLFEPLWNAQYVDHVQITVAETVGIGGRGAYYDRSGAMRDMVQNHLMQLLCLTAMEAPTRFDPGAVRDEKLKVIRALDPVKSTNIVRGQYSSDSEGPSYREDVESFDSTTESYIALRVDISNWRWKGTPFYLRTGKRLKARMSEIVIHFKEAPHSIFEEQTDRHANVLSIRLQPDEGIDLMVTIKEPGPGGMRLVDVPLDMTFADALGPEAAAAPEAYERLIMDVIRGDQTLFMRGDEVEAAWAWTDPLIEGWKGAEHAPLPYAPGSDGPDAAAALMARDSRAWREIIG
ncbi:MAG: glucose-6-phosphate dehydrogenase [Pseudomonadota bacterium]